MAKVHLEKRNAQRLLLPTIQSGGAIPASLHRSEEEYSHGRKKVAFTPCFWLFKVITGEICYSKDQQMTLMG